MSTIHKKIGLFPGAFDPITYGHLDIIVRAADLFDELVVAVGYNPNKQTLFTLDERVEMTRTLVEEKCGSHVRVGGFDGLTVDYAREVGATALLRGLRNGADLNYEFQLALTNRAIADLETVFIMSGESWGFTSSTLIKQIASAGEIKRLKHLLPDLVLEALADKKAEQGGHF